MLSHRLNYSDKCVSFSSFCGVLSVAQNDKLFRGLFYHLQTKLGHSGSHIKTKTAVQVREKAEQKSAGMLLVHSSSTPHSVVY